MITNCLSKVIYTLSGFLGALQVFSMSGSACGTDRVTSPIQLAVRLVGSFDAGDLISNVGLVSSSQLRIIKNCSRLYVCCRRIADAAAHM